MGEAGGDHAALLDDLRAMQRIRACEEKIAAAYRDGQLPGLLHLSIGGEAVAVGVAGELGAGDRLFTGHRGHGHFLAMGTTPRELMAELAGRETGLCRGRGGSMHLMGERAVMATGVVGGTLPVAVGHAVGLPEPDVAVVMFGDGSVQAGVFHEAINLAAIWGARVLFVCENNGVAEFTKREEHTVVGDVVGFGRMQQMETEVVDGGDVEAVRAAARGLLAGIRETGKPAMLECHITRMRSHYEGDVKRETEDHPRDPLNRINQRLRELGAEEDVLQEIQAAAEAEAEQAFAQALADPEPNPADDAGLVYARALS